jgi:hypothetical protein
MLIILVIIDRKYNRTNDTGRFELIHRGAPVPIPIYIGIDLRVEGKLCKTGRTNNNNSNTKVTAPVSAPPHISASKDLSTGSSAIPPYSSSALDNRHDISSAKTVDITQPSIDPNDTISSTDSAYEKIDDCQYHFTPNNTSNQLSIKKNDARFKQLKTNSNRISVNALPVRRLNRLKVNDHVSSSKGK